MSSDIRIVLLEASWIEHRRIAATPSKLKREFADLSLSNLFLSTFVSFTFLFNDLTVFCISKMLDKMGKVEK